MELALAKWVSYPKARHLSICSDTTMVYLWSEPRLLAGYGRT